MSLDWRDICVGALVCATLVGVVRYGMEKSSRKVLPLPPGPRPIPIIGNIRGIAINAPWLAYTEWGKRYGVCDNRSLSQILLNGFLGRRHCILTSALPTHCCDQLRESGH